MKDLELWSIYVGLCFSMCEFIICESSNGAVRKSCSEPSKLVISFEHQSLDLALKSPIMTVRRGLLHNSTSRFNFRFDLNI